MHARLSRPLAVATATVLVALAGCDATDPAPAADPPRSEVHRADLFDPASLPAGSSGTLVAARDGELLVCEGWGLADDAAGTEADCDTVYDVMSMTKQFTAAAVLRLQMDGRLRVTDPIGRFLPGVPADRRAVTIEHLLTHTSGLPEGLGGDYDAVTRDELVAGALAVDLEHPPGRRYRYSNLGYSLLAAIVELASGQGYEEYLRQRLLEPAGMTSTGFVLPRWDRSDVATEYDARGRSQGRPFDHPWADDGPWWNLRGNGGLLSTARDLFRWHRALEGDDVLDEASRRALFRPRVREEPGGESRYAFGWVVLPSPFGTVQWHNGGNGWSYGEILRVPSAGVFVFWVTNRQRSRSGGWDLERRSGQITGDVVTRLVEETDRSR